MSCTAGDDSPSGAWLIDSGSLAHTAVDCRDFVTYTATPGNVVRGVGGETSIAGRREVLLSLPTGEGNERKVLRLKDVNHIPNSPHNLIGLGRLTDAGMTFEGSGKEFLICGPKGEQVGQGVKKPCGLKGSLYHIDATVLLNDAVALASTAAARSWKDWHRALGHASIETLRIMAKEGMVEGMVLKGAAPKEWFCKACTQGKQRVEPFPKESTTVVTHIGDLTVSDVWGPTQIAGIGGLRYFVSFTDVATRHWVLYFIKEKTKVLDQYKAYKAFIRNRHSKALRTVRFDNGTEYVNAPLKLHAAAQGTTIETTAPHSSSQNGIAERLNLTIANLGRSMRIAAGLPKKLWPQAFGYACFIVNRSYTQSLPGFKTPYERFNGSKPDLSMLREWGSNIWVLDQSGNNKKLDACSTKRKFVGVDSGGRSWLYWSEQQRTILASRNVKFPPTSTLAPPEDNEPSPTEFQIKRLSETTKPPLKAEPPTPVKPIPVIPSPIPVPPAVPDLPLPLTRSRRQLPTINYDKVQRRGKKAVPEAKEDIFGPYLSDKLPKLLILFEPDAVSAVLAEDATYDVLFEVGPAYLDVIMAALGIDPSDCPSYPDAMKGPEREFWREATTSEIAQMHATGTWELAVLPNGKTAIKCGWVLDKKRNADGIVVRHKGRLVAKGYSQVKGVDYELTFAPVLRLDAFRLLCAIAAVLDLDIHQMDVIGAFLNGILDEEIYMEQPPGFHDGTDRVLRLKKTIYGLKQSARVWNKRLHDALLSLGYMRLYADSCVYTRRLKGKLAILAFHVDDLAVFTSKGDATHVKGELAALFDMRDLGELHHFVGFRVTRNRSKKLLSLSQDAYLRDIVKHAGLESANPQPTPMRPKLALARHEGPSPPDANYLTMIGMLMYAALGTRPDISYATQYLAQFSNCFGPEHVTAVKHVFRYIKGSPTRCITYDGRIDNGQIKEIGYVDANWGLDIIDRRSVSGLVFTVAGGAVAWSSKKQATVSLSSMEAEYMGVAYGVRHALWLCTILRELVSRPKVGT